MMEVLFNSNLLNILFMVSTLGKQAFILITIFPPPTFWLPPLPFSSIPPAPSSL